MKRLEGSGERWSKGEKGPSEPGREGEGEREAARAEEASKFKQEISIFVLALSPRPAAIPL